MTIKERALGWVAAQAARVHEAITGNAVGRAFADEDGQYGFRPLSERQGMRRDLSPMSQQEMLRVAHYIYTTNPLGQFLVNIPTALLLGCNLSYALEFDHEHLGMTKEEADNEIARARRFLDPWWTHPVHNFERRVLKYARTFLVTGELPLLVTKVNPVTGLFQTDYVDSELVTGVEGLNGLSSVPGTLLLRSQDGSGEPKRVTISREGAFAGEESALFFYMADRLNSMRGFSWLLAVGDWVDAHDQASWGQVDRTIIGNNIVHDITVTGAQEGDLKKHADNFRKATAKPGGAHVHNEKLTHEIKTPDLDQAGNVELVRALRLFVIGSKGVPEHWFGSGDTTNKGTGGEQNEVAMKIMESLQSEIGDVFQAILNIGYDELAKKQGFPLREEGGVKIYPKLPKISEKDITQIGGVFAQTEAALASAVDGGRLSNVTAQKVIYSLVEKITGQPVDETAEQALIDAEAAEREKRRADDAKAAADRLSKAVVDNTAA